MSQLEFCIHYPFTSVAKAALEQSGIAISDRIVELALQRIKTALKEGKVAKSSALHDSEKIENIASYAAARMILGFSRNRFLINAYAVAESKRASDYLDGESDEIIDKVAGEFNIKTEEKNGNLLIPVHIYLKYSPRDVHYRLSNRELANGYVKLKSRHEKIRLIEGAIKKHMEKIPLVKSPPESIKIAAEKLKEFLPKIQRQEISFSLASGEVPPCIEKLLDSLKKHENLPHQARWYLAVYLIGRGMPMEEIVSLYSNLPDYNEKITRYQLDHAKKKGYAVPACATILTWGLCCADCKIGSPLNWQKLGKADRESLLKTGRRI
ncbi:hypothetical protein J4450_05920 [Candidatus Micrarchaeota archaeon]|nr:hypothetical protein [Candidatus Micrarchaeota archaeon]